jgi:hypothetical protein
MESSSIFTRRRMGFDNNVWYVMAICCILSAGLFGYSAVKRKDVKPCGDLSVHVNGRINTDSIYFDMGQPIIFRSPFSPGNRVIWDFGDATAREEGFSLVHTYNRASKFTVTVIVNGNCRYYKTIIVKKPYAGLLDSTGNTIEDIIGQEDVFVGETISYKTMRTANTYEWYVENNNNYPRQKGKEINIKFRGQGLYILVLVLDGDRRKKYIKKILVSSDPAKVPEELRPDRLIKKLPLDTAKDDNTDLAVHKSDSVKKPTTKSITDEIFKTYLQALVCGGMEVKSFNDYLCMGDKTPVIINNKQSSTFGAMCADIKGKKIKIESVISGRDNDGCVYNLTIKYDKKGLFRNPCK